MDKFSVQISKFICLSSYHTASWAVGWLKPKITQSKTTQSADPHKQTIGPGQITAPTPLPLVHPAVPADLGGVLAHLPLPEAAPPAAPGGPAGGARPSARAAHHRHAGGHLGALLPLLAPTQPLQPRRRRLRRRRLRPLRGTKEVTHLPVVVHGRFETLLG